VDLAAVSLGPNKVSALKPLAEHAEPVSHGPENLDCVTSTAPKHKDVATERVVFKDRLDLCGQPLEAAALMWCTT
jgi:hypothetical protein